MARSKSTSAPKAQSRLHEKPIIQNRLKVQALCELLNRGANCAAGAYAAGEAAGQLYLELLRSREKKDGWKVSDLHAVVEAICANCEHETMLFGFTSALHWPLYVGTQAVPPSEPQDIEQLMTAVRAGLEKTQRESDREFNSEKAKRGWETRRASAAEGAQS